MAATDTVRAARRGVDRLLHPRTLAAAGDDLRRARILVGVLAVFIVGAPFATANLLLGARPHLAIAPLSVLATSLVLLLLLRRGAPAAPLGLGLSAVVTAVISAAAFQLGGLASPALLALDSCGRLQLVGASRHARTSAVLASHGASCGLWWGRRVDRDDDHHREFDDWEHDHQHEPERRNDDRPG